MLTLFPRIGSIAPSLHFAKISRIVKVMNKDGLRELLVSLVAVDSIGSVVLRGGIWFLIATVIIISTDNPSAAITKRSLKRNLGFLLLFIFLSGGLIYLLFGFTISQA